MGKDPLRAASPRRLSLACCNNNYPKLFLLISLIPYVSTTSEASRLRRGAGRAPRHPPLLAPWGRSAGRFFRGGEARRCPALRGRARAPERGARTPHGAPPPLAEEMPNFPLPPRRRRARSRGGRRRGWSAAQRARGGPRRRLRRSPPPPRPEPVLASPRCPGRCCCSAWPSGRPCAPPGEHPAGRGAPRSPPQFPRRGEVVVRGGVTGLRAPGRSSLPAPEALRLLREMLRTWGPRFGCPEPRGRPVSRRPVSDSPSPPRRPNPAGG